MVLLSAIGLDADSWRLAAIPGATPMTLSGFGDRPRPAEGLSLALMADDVASRTSGPLDIVGVSLGAMVAMRLALRHRDRVRSLVLACAAASADPQIMRQRAEAVRTGGLAASVPATLERWFGRAPMDSESQAVAVARRQLNAVDPRSMEQAWMAVAEHDVRGELAGIDVPATVIAARDDAAVPLEALIQLHAGLPDARLVILAGGHMVHLENPDRFRTEIMLHDAWVNGAGVRA